MNRIRQVLSAIALALSSALFFALHGAAQQSPTIRIPVRIVSVPTLVVSTQGKYIPGLAASDFRLTDNGRPQSFKFDTDSLPISIAVAVQVDQDVREYVRFIANVGNLLDNSLAAAMGEAALIEYNDEVSVAKPFGVEGLHTAFRSISPSGHGARMIDAGLRAIALLKERTGVRSRVLLFIGQPTDDGTAQNSTYSKRKPSGKTSRSMRWRCRSSANRLSPTASLYRDWGADMKRVSTSQKLFQPCGEPDRLAPVAIHFRC